MIDPRLRPHLLKLEDRIVEMEKEEFPDYDMITKFYAKMESAQKVLNDQEDVDRIEAEEDRSEFDEKTCNSRTD